MAEKRNLICDFDAHPHEIVKPYPHPVAKTMAGLS